MDGSGVAIAHAEEGSRSAAPNRYADSRALLRSIGHFAAAREGYYEKLRALAQRYNFTLIEFKEHDEDPAFLYRHQTHLTAKGWMFYDRALDDFFHGRVPRT